MWTHSSGDDQFHPIGTGPVLIQGVGTSTAGFVGQSERGPATPRLVTGWADYERWFGGPVDSSLSSLPWAVGFASARLHGGDDGPNPATVADYQGNTTAGLSALEAVEEIALLLQCERRKDRFAVLQERDGQSNPQTIRVDRASRYGATYWPWIRAPANQVVRGIVTGDSPGDLGPLEARGDQGSPGHPRPQGVNVIRDFPAAGHGIRVWGARTLADDPQWRYVNVVRLVIFFKASIDKGTRWTVFEPNDETTWARVPSSFAATAPP